MSLGLEQSYVDDVIANEVHLNGVSKIACHHDDVLI